MCAQLVENGADPALYVRPRVQFSSSTTTQQMAWLVRGRGARWRHRDRRSGEEQPRRLLERAERGVRRLHHSRGAQECGGEARRHLLTGDSGTYCSHAVSMFSAVHMHISMVDVHMLRTYRVILKYGAHAVHVPARRRR